MSNLKLYVFGPPRLEIAGQPVEFNLRKALGLLVYLAVSGRAQSRDALVALLWPESGPREGRARLRRTLYRLGQALGEDVLDGEADTIRLHPRADLWLDRVAFEHHAAAGLDLSAAYPDANATRIEHLRSAAALYTADFLAGWTLPDSPAFDEWQFFEREDLRVRVARVLDRLVELYIASGALEQALDYARDRVAHDPLHEPAHCTLMRLYAWTGQQAAALRQYQECARILGAELGTTPDDETTAVYEQIKARRLPPPDRRLPAAAIATAYDLATAGTPPAVERGATTTSIEQGVLADADGAVVVGREAEMAPLDSRLDNTADLREARALLDQIEDAGASQPEQHVRFCLSADGVRIAYATAGTGPPLVKAANWLSHLEFDWQSPVWRHWLTGLSKYHTLVRYDERACGLSDWEVPELSVDAFVRDLEAVVAALGLERFPLLGISQGGAVAITYAVRHPEQVSHLILYGAYARGRFNRGYSQQQIEQGRIILDLIRLGWGQDNPATRQYFTSLFMPEAPGALMRAFNELQRVSASPQNAARIMNTVYHIEVTELLPRVKAPTLVLHVRDDGIVPMEESRHLAALIPGARFVALEGKNHILRENEPAWPRFLAEVQRFLAEDGG